MNQAARFEYLVHAGSNGSTKKSVDPTPYIKEVQSLRREISRITASYDAAQTSYGNEAHWASADHLGPNNAAKASVRKKLRSRSRYEICENNPYLKGMVLKLANAFVGSGPSLYITDKRIPQEIRPAIAEAWQRYAKAIKLRQLCQRLRGPRTIDGEGIAINVTSDIKDQVKSYWRIIETDQITADYNTTNLNSADNIDGVRLAEDGETPESYYVLNQHPGDNTYFHETLQGQWIDASNVIQWFRKDRPWVRGVPEGVSILPLCSILRRYTLAVVQAAEVAANMSVLLESEAPPSLTAFGSVSELQTMTPQEIASMWFDTFPMYRGTAMSLPWGMKASQMKAEQPTAVYDKFVDALLREIAQPFLLPFNAAVGFSGNYNMASGTLDVQMWNDAIAQDRYLFEEDVLDPKIFSQWWFEAVRIPGYFENQAVDNLISSSASIKNYGIAHTWGWDRKSTHPDPLRTSNSVVAQWQSGFITDEDIQSQYYNRSIPEWEQSIQRQNKFREANGLPLPGVTNQQTSDKKDAQDEDTKD